MRTTLLFMSIIVFAACDQRPASSTESTRPASAKAPAAEAEATNAIASPTADGCDVTIVPAEHIGDRNLAGERKLEAQIEPGKTYCAFGVKSTSKTTLAEIKAAAPAGCAESTNVGATQLTCLAQGVSFTFAGPMSRFERVAVFRKDTSKHQGASPPTETP